MVDNGLWENTSILSKYVAYNISFLILFFKFSTVDVGIAAYININNAFDLKQGEAIFEEYFGRDIA